MPFDGLSTMANPPLYLFHAAHPVSSAAGDEAYVAQEAGRISNKLRHGHAQGKRARTCLTLECMEPLILRRAALSRKVMGRTRKCATWKRSYVIWISRSANRPVEKSCRASLSTSITIAKTMRQKLPRELRDMVYRRYWELYDQDWLVEELSQGILCDRYEKLQFGRLYKPADIYGNRPVQEQAVCCPYETCQQKLYPYWQSDTVVRDHIKDVHSTIKTESLTNNTLIQTQYVGTHIAREAVMGAYAVSGCARLIPTDLRLPDHSLRFMHNIALGNLNAMLHKDVFGLGV
ncbi:hypothetical protein BU23DRAFT_652621 [Bimuria novae-zelandiae CBS 107.79]|uniref:Uncharacterized protein n=1 Tax=Bimuria novae-zelandiae CBS 107.79 TaxID=1447943 RepID=A0A6A5V8A9_9PLEO|nr:hypothetical protein BU23DRAFT_652621 [Bimuria novae-zelandiae CBS 107.79]